MDIERIRALARQLDQAAHTLGSVIAEISSSLDSTLWTGPDAVEFQGAWRADSLGLASVVNRLLEASQKAMASAQAQENASAR